VPKREAPETPMTKIDAQKCITLTIWPISEIQSPFPLTKRIKSHPQHLSQHLIPDIQRGACSSNRRRTSNDILSRLGNALAHNSWLSSEKIESAKAERVSHAPYD
jgi:hypothetical protein